MTDVDENRPIVFAAHNIVFKDTSTYLSAGEGVIVETRIDSPSVLGAPSEAVNWAFEHEGPPARFKDIFAHGDLRYLAMLNDGPLYRFIFDDETSLDVTANGTEFSGSGKARVYKDKIEAVLAPYLQSFANLNEVEIAAQLQRNKNLPPLPARVKFSGFMEDGIISFPDDSTAHIQINLLHIEGYEALSWYATSQPELRAVTDIVDLAQIKFLHTYFWNGPHRIILVDNSMIDITANEIAVNGEMAEKYGETMLESLNDIHEHYEDPSDATDLPPGILEWHLRSESKN